MHQSIARQLIVAATACLAMFSQANASTVINFEGESLTGLYFAGDSFSESGFKMTVDFDAGIVDAGLALAPFAPTGNATQFYTQLNDGALILQRSDGGHFNLDGFSAAFVPLSVDPAAPTVMVALDLESGYGVAWLFGASTNNNFPFLTYNYPADFAVFQNVTAVEFFACSLLGPCDSPTKNNGQFAIDNINVTAVPEPTTVALMTLGLLGLGIRARRVSR